MNSKIKMRLINLKKKNRNLKRINYIKKIFIPQTHNPVNAFIYSQTKETIANASEILDKKILVLFACHTNSEIKLKALMNNLQYFKKTPNIDFVVINSIGACYSENLKMDLQNKCIYYEIDNANTYDFGKWVYALKNVNYASYNNIIFTNDSYIIHDNIDRFLIKSATTNVELYGYNDSSQTRYHYQSYLFSINSSAIYKFISMYNLNESKIHCQQDVINFYELQMLNYFSSYDCYLKIGNIPFNKGNDIFFTNDYFYKQLINSKLLPFTKIKRIS